MLKKVVYVIGLTYNRDSTRILQLDGTNVKIIGVVKDVLMKLYKYLKVSFI